MIGAGRGHISADMNQLPQRPSGLDDPHHAAHAWTRFRRMLVAMAAAAMALALLVVAFLWWRDGPLPLIFVGLTIAGVWATVMMAALLMGLMFLSSGTGHDDQIEDKVGREVLGDDED